MNKLVIAAVALVAFSNVAKAEGPTWTEVQRACGTEYREADKANRGTWQEFLSECKGRKGFQPKRAAGTFRLPDVQKQ